MPSQCACHELAILPWNNQAIEWPMPHPGHHVIPTALNGQRLYCPGREGSLKARAMSAAIQNTSSKYFEKILFLFFNGVPLGHEQ